MGCRDESPPRQSGDYTDETPLTDERVHALLEERLLRVDMAALKNDVSPFLHDRNAPDCWSRDFFLDVFRRLHASAMAD